MKTFKLDLIHWKWKNPNSIMLLSILFMTTCYQLNSQTSPIETQEMRLIGELPGHVDVKFRVVKCDNTDKNQVFLFLHNESEKYGAPNDVTSGFEIVILDYESGKSFTKNITISTTVGQKITADCEKESLLKIDLPFSYSPSSIAAYVKIPNN
ncbi:hypothetical protein GSB9_03127 [Flavobacteriaceae bacterium GSB9]|nr:hypothetical protein GSB9_03127 [Flavobacteriaceae bacterium GSB9]